MFINLVGLTRGESANILVSVVQHSKPARLGIGIISAGRVGAVLGAALRACEHTIVGVHAVSEASRERAAQLLPEYQSFRWSRLPNVASC